MKRKLSDFKTLTDLVADPLFIESVTGRIALIKKQRLKRQAPKKGYNYKKDWVDMLRANGNLTPTYFISNIGAIWAKDSKLSRNQRDLIQSVCEECLRAIVEYEPIAKPSAEVEKELV